MRTHEECPACGGGGDLTADGEAVLEAKLKRATLIRDHYLAAHRVLRFVHLYRAEVCSKPGDDWRKDRRILDCLARVRDLRGRIAALREPMCVPHGHLAWCISCQGSGLVDVERGSAFAECGGWR